MRIEKAVFLSYVLDENTPTYGNRNQFLVEKKSDISKGDVANDSSINTTVHIGTHIDMPYHFYDDGQTVEYFDADFWMFSKKEILFLELRIDNGELIIRDKLINKLEDIKNNSQFSILNYKLLIVKTGICHKRKTEEFWSANYGFHPDIYDYLTQNFPNVRIFGFDSISVSSFANRELGRVAHKRFLNPRKPILLLEDMDLRYVDENTNFEEVIISPLRIANCDGLPCTVIGKVYTEKFSILNSQFSTILWDFDGVILNSMKIKGDGFVELFKEYDQKAVQKLEQYHYANGGISRFEKIKYFFIHILKQNITENEVEKLAERFAIIIAKKLFDKSNLIPETIKFIKSNYKKYNFHIVSGAQHDELNNLCEYFEIEQYFLSINGSPTKKEVLVKNILEKYDYNKEEVILIGDSINDYNAACENDVKFCGFNNKELTQYGDYIDGFEGCIF